MRLWRCRLCHLRQGEAGVSYTPYGGIEKVWKSRATEVLAPGPAGTGKTRGILEKVHLYLLKYPKTRGLICRKTRASMTESVLVTFEAKVVQVGCDLNNQSRRTRSSYDYDNGSVLVVGGLDNPDRIMSTEYDIIAVFEATECSEDDWEKLTTRLRNGKGPYHQIVADCNPASPSHWLKRRADRGQMEVFECRHQDNPVLWDRQAKDWTEQGRKYLATLQSLTGHRRARLLDGKWSAAEGLVYPEFNTATHVVASMPAGWEKWPKLRSIDFGFVHPFVCQWWAIDPDGRMWLYREIYQTKRTVAEHAAIINRYSDGETYVATITDHDAEDRATLAAHGIQSVPAMKDHRTGRDAMHERLRVQGDGKPRLLFLAGCTLETDRELYQAKKPTNTVAEFDCHIYPPGQDGKAPKEEPIKLYDDGLDAARYAVMHQDAAGRGHGAAVLTVHDAAAGILATDPDERAWA
jgi:PBSX family phage terminase large subunit